MIRSFRNILRTFGQSPAPTEFVEFLDNLNDQSSVHDVDRIAFPANGLELGPPQKEERDDVPSAPSGPFGTSGPSGTSGTVEGEEKTTFVLRKAHVYDILSPWKQIFQNTETKYCISYFANQYGLYMAISLAMQPDFLFYTVKEQKAFVARLCEDLLNHLDQFFDTKRYRLYGYVKKDMQQILFQMTDRFHPSILHYLSDFLGKNILLLETDAPPFQLSLSSPSSTSSISEHSFLPCGKYEWLSPFESQRQSIVCHKHGFSLWGSFICGSATDDHLNINLVRIQTFFVAKSPVEPKMFRLDETEKQKLRALLQSMTAKEIQQRALEMGIDVADSQFQKKKKTKATLTEEIFAEMCD